MNFRPRAEVEAVVGPKQSRWRRFGRAFWGAALLLSAGAVWGAEAPIPEAITCDTQTLPPIDPGSTPLMPGHWHNPNRYGTGWDFYFLPNSDTMIAYWYTYDSRGVPVWYSGVVQSLPVGTTTWSTVLNRVTLSNTGARTVTQVGTLSGRLYPGAATHMAVNWTLDIDPDNRYLNPPSECLYDIFRESPLTNAGVRANPGYNGLWFDPNHDFWSYNYSTGTMPDGSYSDTEKAVIYDVSGQPVWLIALTTEAGNPPSNTTGAPRVLNYPTGVIQSNQNRWRPDIACTKDDHCFDNRSGGSVSRNFTTTATAAASTISVSVQAGLNGVLSNAAVTWPNPALKWPSATVPGGSPLTFPTTLIRGTQIDHVYVGSSVCEAPVGSTTCSVYVAWASTPPASGPSPNKVYRRNLIDGTTTLYSNLSSGNLNDPQPPGSRVQYELRNGAATGPLIAQSAEVLVTSARTGRYDSGDGSPDPAPAPTAFQEPTLDIASDKVGALDGEFKVTEGGHASYRVNVFAPRGRGGLTPTVALTYSSSGGEGTLGTGFNLEATSSIQRCRSGNEFGDGNVVSSNLDQFCLDGQRLLRMSGGADSRNTEEFRTEIESFQRIVRTPVSITSGGATVPSFVFTVTGKDGSVRTFGGDAGTVVGNRYTTRTAIAWQQTSLADVSGNTITYVWSTQAGLPLTSLGQRTLDQITYSGGRIDFFFRDSNRRDTSFSNIGDALSTKVLGNITVRGADNSVLRYYPITYDTSVIGSLAQAAIRPRVKRINECADTSMTTCYRPTQFDWIDPSPLVTGQSIATGTSMFSGITSYRLGDFDGDGRSDFVWTNSGGKLKVVYSRPTSNGISFAGNAQVAQLSGVDPVGAFQTYDWDVDGYDDLIYLSASSTPNKVSWYWARSTGSGFAAPQVLLADVGNYDTSDHLRFESTLVDNDGDGLPDLMYRIGVSDYRIALMERTGDPSLPYRLATPLRVEVWDREDGQGLNACAASSYTPRRDEERPQTVDVDGDGRGDLRIMSTADACKVYDGGIIGDALESGQTESVQPEDSPSTPLGTPVSYYFATYKSVGKQTASSNEVVFRFIRSGRTVRVMEDLAADSRARAAQRVMSADLNADGYTDIVFLDRSGQWWWSLTSGETIFGTDGLLPAGIDGNHRDKVQLLDFDGDGKLDFWWPDSSTPSRNYKVYLWKGSGFSVNPISTGFIATEGNDWIRMSGDYDGDGLVDNLVVKPSDGGWQTNRSMTHHQPRGVVGTITNGLGATTIISYAPLTFSSVYRRDYDGVVRDWGRKSPVIDLTMPSYVVQSVGSSAPVQGDENALAMVQYRYAGLKLQSGGRGSLGFRNVRSIDMQTNVQVDTTYAQEFPMTGMPTRTETKLLASVPGDACHGVGGQVVETSACFNVVPQCPSTRTNVCDQWPTNASDRRYRTTGDALGWRYQRKLGDNDPSFPMNGYNISLSQVAVPYAGQVSTYTVPIFVGRMTLNTYNYSDDATNDQVSSTAMVIPPDSGYDAFGNVLSTKSTTRRRLFPRAGEDDTAVVTETRSTYANDAVAWKLGRLNQTLTFVTRNETRGGAVTTTTQGRRASFTYDDPQAPADQRKLLRSERVDAMTGSSVDTLAVDAAARTVVTYYTLDAAGNRIKTSTCSAVEFSEATCRTMRGGQAGYLFHPAGRQVMRYGSSTYDGLLRYVDSTIGAVSTGPTDSREATLSTVIARNAGGDATDVQDANGVVARSRYGKLGRLRYTYGPDGSSSRTDFALCTDTPCPANMALAYVVTTTTSGAPNRWSFHDKLGRPVIALQAGLSSGDYIATVTYYDSRGNVSRVSEPFYTTNGTTGAATPRAGETLAWTVTDRDAPGRVVSVTAPDGGLTTTSYVNLTRVITLPLNAANVRQQTTEIMSPQGEVTSVTDHKGLTVTFAYDAMGQALRATRNGKVTSTTYDGLGRKVAMSDPDTGAWAYAVNDVGETTQQATPRGKCFFHSYDGAGRLYTRRDYATASCTSQIGISTWQFDTATNGVGKLASETSDDLGTLTRSRDYIYNSIGQPIGVNTTQDGRTYVAQSTYDQYGRPFQSFFTAPGLFTTGEKNEYNAQGYAVSVRSAYPAVTGPVYQEILAMDARGKVKSERHMIGAAVLTSREFNPQTGRLTHQEVQNGTLQDIDYDHDQVGNVRYRQSFRDGITQRETFAYDELQRLTSSTFTRNGGAAGNAAQSYDGEGNILAKGGRGYTYSGSTAGTCATVPGAVAPGPHAVTRAGVVDYCYDASGNVLRIAGVGDNRELAYTEYEALRSIRSNTNNTRTAFYYGPNREKVRRSDFASAAALSPNAITDYVSGAEVRMVGGVIDEVSRYVGTVMVKQRRQGTDYPVVHQYMVTDLLGSTELVLDIWGQVANTNASMSFDVFGQRRDAGTWTTPAPWTPSLRTDLDATTRHGYTGHEQADEVGIVHMNGRIYDPQLGRFLQADPFVQAPTNGQSHNRYSYVFNNPMAYTDPTGYFGSKERAGVRTGVAIIASFVVPQLLQYTTLSATQAAMVTGAVVGGIQSGNVRGAAMGALTAAAFSGIDRAFGVVGGDASGLSSSKFALRALANGAAGGVLASVQGGRFGHGFINAGVGDYLSPANPAQDTDAGDVLGMTMAGGTLSAISGGDFVNGAMTAAFKVAVRRAGQVALNRRMAIAAYSNRNTWSAFEWDVFFFLSVQAKIPFAPVSPTGEVVGLVGVSSKDSIYAGAIFAGGVSVTAPNFEGSHMEGVEITTASEREWIKLNEAELNVGVPYVANAEAFVGTYELPASKAGGAFVGAGAEVTGLDVSAGFGGTVDFSAERTYLWTNGFKQGPQPIPQ